MTGRLDLSATLSAQLLRKDGSTGKEVLREISPLANPLWRRWYRHLRRSRVIPLSMSLAAFVQAVLTCDSHAIGQALVVTVGANYLAADFLSTSTSHIQNFNYHDSGIGTTPEATTDTALVTQAGPATRTTGTQSTPVAGQYRTTATITYSGALTIAEWGLFNQAAQGGVLWDRRKLASAISVVSGDAIQFVYTLTVNAGGS